MQSLHDQQKKLTISTKERLEFVDFILQIVLVQLEHTITRKNIFLCVFLVLFCIALFMNIELESAKFYMKKVTVKFCFCQNKFH